MPKPGDRRDPKTAALLEEGTLNPSPEKVSDTKFQASDFFDARDLVQVRYELLRRVSVDNLSVTRLDHIDPLGPRAAWRVNSVNQPPRLGRKAMGHAGGGSATA